MMADAENLIGLRVHSRRGVGFVVVALFAVYAATMSRSISFYDSPELALVAEQWGLGHPFGQPLHTLVGGLFARIPGIDPIVALNALSALAGALTVVPATSLAQTLLSANRDTVGRVERLVAPTVGCIGVLPSLWEPATRIEVYPLAVFLSLWAIAYVAPELCAADPGARASVFRRAGGALGLAASANPVCATGAALALLPMLAVGFARHHVRPRHLGAIAGGGALGLLPYAYVFLVAGREDVVVWGSPTDADAIRHYFSGADFASKRVEGWHEWANHVVALTLGQFEGGLLALVTVGFVGLLVVGAPAWFGASLLGITLAFFVGFIARNGVFAPDVLDYLGYLALPGWIGAAGVGLLVARAAEHRPRPGHLLVALVCAWAILAPPSLFERSRHRDFVAETASFEALRAAPRNAILILERDHWVGPVLYLQERLHVRPDVVAIAYGLSSSSWYWNHLYRRHPDLHAFELRGSGGRPARLARFLERNPTRPVQIERVELADRLSLSACPADWFLDVQPECNASQTRPALADLAKENVAELGDGSPGTSGLLALMTFDRGHDLFRLGHARAAVDVLLSGVPVADSTGIDLSTIPERIVAQEVSAPRYEPAVALGHPARNLHYAAMIARATHAEELATYFSELADALGPVTPKTTGSRPSPANL
ncbi:MAG: DUF2723 domain-containing protein [Myxococcota bacterium]